jgi:hypothetical protein
MNIEVPTKYPLSRDRIVVFIYVSTAKARCSTDQRSMATEMLLSPTRRALKDKFPTPTVPLTTVLKIVRYFCRTLY